MNQDGTAITPSTPSFSGSDDPNQNPTQNPVSSPAPTPTSAPTPSVDPAFLTRVAAAPGQDNFAVADTTPPAKTSSNRKIIIIGAIAAIVMLIAIGVVLLTQQISKNQNNFSLQQLFNDYASYIVNGESSMTFELGEYDPSKKYAASEKIYANSGRGDDEYLKVAYEKFDAFYKKAKEEIKTNKINTISGYRYDVLLVRLYNGIGVTDEDALIDLLNTRGREVALRYVDDFYEEYRRNGYDKSYPDLMTDSDNDTIEIEHIIKVYCPDDTESSYEEEYCDEEHTNAISELRADQDDKIESAASEITEARANMVFDLWSVKEAMNAE